MGVTLPGATGLPVKAETLNATSQQIYNPGEFVHGSYESRHAGHDSLMHPLARHWNNSCKAWIRSSRGTEFQPGGLRNYLK